MTIREHEQRNAESRQRLTELVNRLGEDELRLPMGEHWTIAAGLLHLSFWDRFTLEWWADAERRGLTTPGPVDEYTEDLINDTLTPLLLLGSLERVRAQVLGAAQAADDYIAGLPEATVELVGREGRPRLIDRSIHRREHLAEIEQLLARKAG
jgi:hypothetical protein